MVARNPDPDQVLIQDHILGHGHTRIPDQDHIQEAGLTLEARHIQEVGLTQEADPIQDQDQDLLAVTADRVRTQGHHQEETIPDHLLTLDLHQEESTQDQDLIRDLHQEDTPEHRQELLLELPQENHREHHPDLPQNASQGHPLGPKVLVIETVTITTEGLVSILVAEGIIEVEVVVGETTLVIDHENA